MKRDETCATCGRRVDARLAYVLVLGRRHEPHCSAACLEDHVRARRLTRARVQRRFAAGLSLAALVIAGVGTTWRRFHAQRSHSISLDWPERPDPDPPPPTPVIIGPPWPPTDQQWTAVLDGARGVFPIPGPTRREVNIDGRIFGLDPPRDQPPPRCREDGRCTVDLGGELWGEHVYAALDGVVERIQGGDDERRGGHFVRIAHFGGQVFTQYFHLAAMPRGIVRGAHVKAGDVIGLLGDTGLENAPRHLTFALSIRPSSAYPEVYWDPKPWLARWPLHTPQHGTVAGYLPRQNP